MQIRKIIRFGMLPLLVYAIAELKKLPVNQHNYNTILLLLFMMVFLVVVFGNIAVQERTRANALEESFNNYLEKELLREFETTEKGKDV